MYLLLAQVDTHNSNNDNNAHFDYVHHLNNSNVVDGEVHHPGKCTSYAKRDQAFVCSTGTSVSVIRYT